MAALDRGVRCRLVGAREGGALTRILLPGGHVVYVFDLDPDFNVVGRLLRACYGAAVDG